MGIRNICYRPHTDAYQRQKGNPKFVDIVDLSDVKIHDIQTKIPELPKELEKSGAIVLT